MDNSGDPKFQKVRSQLQSFLDDCQISQPQGLKLLEVGFKEGLFMELCRDAGIQATGLEVVESYYNRLHREHPELDLVLYDGMAMPLADASFDAVVSYQVLEHVGSLETTLAECIRVLKPGGIMYHVVPNYHSFYEGHYGVFWWPFLNQTSGRWYLKLLRKYTPYYESLNSVKPKTLGRIMAAHQEEIEVLSLGKNEFTKRFTPEQINKVNHAMLRGILKGIYNTPLLKKALLGLMTGCGVYYPLILIARRKQPCSALRYD